MYIITCLATLKWYSNTSICVRPFPRNAAASLIAKVSAFELNHMHTPLTHELTHTNTHIHVRISIYILYIISRERIALEKSSQSQATPQSNSKFIRVNPHRHKRMCAKSTAPASDNLHILGAPRRASTKLVYTKKDGRIVPTWNRAQYLLKLLRFAQATFSQTVDSFTALSKNRKSNTIIKDNLISIKFNNLVINLLIISYIFVQKTNLVSTFMFILK